jgi:RAB protein geranylgeranyltransferase component A
MRGFNIDFQPRFFYGNSVTCDILKDADMDKYMDFRIVGKILFLYNGKLEQVPLSKGTIYESKALSLMEKKQLLKTLHTLVKIHNKYKAIESDANSTNEFDKDTSID